MNRQFRQVVTAVLAASMVMPMAACKKGASGKKKEVAQKFIPDDEPYFDTEKTELVIPTDPNKEVETIDVKSTTFINGKLYVPCRVEYEMPDEIEEKYYNAEFTGNYVTAGEIKSEYQPMSLNVFDMDGQCQNTIPFLEADDVFGITVDPNGDIIVLTYCTTKQIPSTLYRFSPEGEEKSHVELSGAYFYMKGIIGLDHNELVMWDDERIVKLDESGQEISTFDLTQIGGMAIKNGDKIFVQTAAPAESNDVNACSIQELDMDNFQLTGNKEQVNMTALTATCFSNGASYMVNANGIVKIDMHTSTTETILDWNDANVNFIYMARQPLDVISNDEMYVVSLQYDINPVTSSPDKSTVYLYHFTRAAKNPYAGKPYLEIASYGACNNSFLDYIVEYNKDPNSQAYVRLHEYKDQIELSKEGKDGFAEKYYLDLMSGNTADILCNFAEFYQFNSENVLVDLNQYIDGENGLKREEYFDNIFRACETNGQLFQMPVVFYVQGLLGNKDYIGDRTGWTYDEFKTAIDGMPDGVSPVDDMLYQDLLNLLLNVNINQFIDYKKKEVHFDSDEFKKALELTKKYGLPVLPKRDDIEDWELEYLEEIPDEYRGAQLIPERFDQNMLALTNVKVYDIKDFAEKTALCKGKATVVGVPSANGAGVAAVQKMSVGISAASPNKDLAWDFIRHLLDEEIECKQALEYIGMPVNRKAFESAMNVKADGLDRIAEDRQAHPSRYMYMEPMPTVSEECKKNCVAVVEKIDTTFSSDMSVMNIVQEEAAAYFADQRTLEEVCANIQKRALQIVQERG